MKPPVIKSYLDREWLNSLSTELPVLKNYINGEWQVSLSEKTGDVRCPATGEKIAGVPHSTAEELDERTHMGPLISAQHKERGLNYIERGLAEGAKLILDGRSIETV